MTHLACSCIVRVDYSMEERDLASGRGAHLRRGLAIGGRSWYNNNGFQGLKFCKQQTAQSV